MSDTQVQVRSGEISTTLSPIPNFSSLHFGELAQNAPTIAEQRQVGRDMALGRSARARAGGGVACV
eukprot:6182460-Pleurochrysis_carterae.AAC.2